MASTSCKFNWYQTDAKVVISIAKRGLSDADCRVTYRADGNLLNVLWKDEVLFSKSLYRPIATEKISLNCSPAKVEVSLEKLESERWPDLIASIETHTKTTPSTSAKSADWERLALEAEKDDEAGDGGGGVEKLFQQIYRNADDDVRKAMMKSFTESCGTVLSTNWADIKAKKTDVKPPDDMEFKQYEI